MKQVLIDRYGTPWEVARCADVADVGEPAADEVVFDVLAFPINPADMWFCRGSYRLKPPLPATPGAECVGRVTAVGSAVKHVRKGDLVINLQRENWAERRKVKGDDAIPLPAGIDLRQAAMVRINPPTAQLMLSDFVDLKPGDWVIQNVANSAVGRLLIVLAKQRGLRTVNVVRRAELAGELKALGADVVVVDGSDLARQVGEATADAPDHAGRRGDRRRGDRPAGRLRRDATARVVHYGSMSGEDPKVTRNNFIYRGVQAHRLHAGPLPQPVAVPTRSARSTPTSAGRSWPASFRRRWTRSIRSRRSRTRWRTPTRAGATARSWSARTGRFEHGGQAMSSEVAAVEKVLQVYFDGLYEGDTKKLGEAFHLASHLYAASGDGKASDWPRGEWFKMVEGRPSARPRAARAPIASCRSTSPARPRRSPRSNARCRRATSPTI